MANPPHHPATYLFTLRLWVEDTGGGQIEWRGQIRQVSSGETRCFRDWATLNAFITELLSLAPNAERAS